MIWVDREVKKIKERDLSLEWVDDMKTPSGRIHIGSLRGVVIHDLVYKTLLEQGKEAKFTYVFDDHDPMDAIPSYLDYSKWEKYAGMQLYKIPSPEKGAKNFAEHYAKEFQQVFESINCHPEIIWASQLYLSGKMNDVIREVLDGSEKIRKIYNKNFERKKPSDWHPFNVICEKCQKVGTTYVYKWDGEFVHYRCEPKMVAWAQGCGNKGKISPFDGNGKMPWRVEWPAKWKVIGVTVEGGGKDHMSAGGSYDVAKEICEKVLDYAAPYPIPYEFFIIGGKKMSSSKGIGTSAAEVAKILPPELLRFLIVRTPIHTAIDFNPYGETISNLFDDYDRCLNAYFDKLDDQIPEGKQGEVLSDFARIIESSQVRPLPEKRIFIPRFRTIVNLVRTRTDILQFFKNQKDGDLTTEEKELLEERIVFAEVYLKNYALQDQRISLLDSTPSNLKLTKEQEIFLKTLSDKLSEVKTKDRDKIQDAVFASLKENSLSPREVFKAFYRVLIGQDHGPKAADLILEFGAEKIIKRIKEILA